MILIDTSLKLTLHPWTIQAGSTVLISVFFQIFASPEFECFATRREVTLEKSSTKGDFGISIIHANHKGLRRKGIFISDIEPDTPALKVSNFRV